MRSTGFVARLAAVVFAGALAACGAKDKESVTPAADAPPASGSSASSDAVALRLRMKPGDVVKLKTTMTTESKTSRGASKQTIVQEMETAATAVAADGVVTQKITWTRVSGTIEQPGQPAKTFDSAGEAKGDPMDKMLTGMAGKSVEARVGSDGKMIEMKGFDAIADEMLKDLPDAAGGMRAMLKKSLSDSSISSLGQLTPPLPPQPVRVGASWPARTDMAGIMGMHLVSDGTTTVTAIDAESVTLRTEATISTPAAPPAAGGGGAPASGMSDPSPEDLVKSMFGGLKIKDGRSTTTLRLSRADGQILRMKTDSTMTMSVPNPMAPGAPEEVGSITVMEIERVR